MKFINIQGRQRPFRFSMYAIDAYCELKKITLSQFYEQVEEVISAKNAESFGDVLYAGLIGGARREHIEVDFTRQDVGDWIDDNPELIPDIVNAFIDGLEVKKKARSPKKKAEPKTLTNS